MHQESLIYYIHSCTGADQRDVWTPADAGARLVRANSGDRHRRSDGYADRAVVRAVPQQGLHVPVHAQRTRPVHVGT